MVLPHRAVGTEFGQSGGGPPRGKVGRGWSADAPDPDRHIALLPAVEAFLVAAPGISAVWITARPPAVPEMQAARPPTLATLLLAGLCACWLIHGQMLLLHPQEVIGTPAGYGDRMSENRDWEPAADRLGQAAAADGEPTRWFEELWSAAARDEIDTPWSRREAYAPVE